MKIKKYSSPHFFKDRGGYRPDMIVLHNTGGKRISSAHYWFLDPESRVSAHYLVGLDGEVRQYVDIRDGAWCNGTSQDPKRSSFYLNSKSPLVRSRSHNANYYTLSVECVGDVGDPLTPLQEEAVADLIRHIAKEVKKAYGKAFLLDKDHLVTHGDINPVTKADCGRGISIDGILSRVIPKYKPKE